MMRIVDVLYGLPFLFFVIMLTMVLGRGMLSIFIAIGALALADHRRDRARPDAEPQAEGIHRGGARRRHAKPLTIVRRHIVPNTIGPVIVYASLLVPEVIIGESFLSYLGLGVQEPLSSWGTLIDSTGPWPWIPSPISYCFQDAPWRLPCSA
jgi:oligopeptide transport system permease protein